jgi:hypothetical protein
MLYLKRFCLFLFFVLSIFNSLSQNTRDTSSFKTIAEGAQYKKPDFYQWLWGRNRRTEWATPVRIPVLWLDTFSGGLVPYKTGGGNETKSLRLKTADEKEYSLRSINKSRADVILSEFDHTFIEDIIVDGISMSHPYGALAVTGMEEAAGIYHTNPVIVYLPQQAALDTFNAKFGDDLYLFEQRLDGDWRDADNLGNFEKFYNTLEVVDSLKSDNNYKADQKAFVIARLFDMLIADWDRHEDQWQWGLVKSNDKLLFQPVPRDRDQAFYTHNGVLIDRIIPIAGLGFMQNFDYGTKDIKPLNYEERNLDRFFTNEMALNDWIDAAQSLQLFLTDAIILKSVQKLPPEIFAISGNELINKLKSRRNHLPEYAADYYFFLAKEVDITGSSKREYFDVRSTDTTTSVNIFSISDEGNKSDIPFYSRTFVDSQTREVRVYGINGEDVYSVNGSGSIKVRIIGGYGKDSIIESGSMIHIYDDHNNVFKTTNAKLHLSPDSAIHAFKYEANSPDRKGFSPILFYNNNDRLYVGIGYGFTNHKWRREPFATRQSLSLNYSISQKAISTTYSALFPNIFKSWNFSLYANYDAVRWTNFFGLGNETLLTTDDKNYFRMRTREWLTTAGIKNAFGKSTVSISAFFQSVKIKNDTGRYVAKIFSLADLDAFENNSYAGLQFNYTFLHLNDSVVPTRGITFSGNASYFSNITQKEFLQRYYGKVQFYIPLGNKFSLAIRAGGATTLCKPEILNSAEFYEHSVIGGPENLRGYNRERIWGKTSFHNNNELRFITNIRTHIINAKAGLLVFFDDGKVWMPGQNSNSLHTAYGTGILIAPFNKVCGTITYGISNESNLFQVRLNKLF